MLSRTAAVIAACAVFFCAGTAFAQSSVDDQRARLQQQLSDITAQINSLQSDLANTQATQNTLQGQLTVLTDQIQVSELGIKRRMLAIQALQANIADKQATIDSLGHKLSGEQASLAAILRATDRLDNSTFVVLALSAPTISEFFSDLGTFSQINDRMQQSFDAIHTDTQVNEDQKADLQSQLDEATQLQQVQQLQQQQLQIQKQQKDSLIAQTKGQETAYQSLIKNKQQTAAQIRAALFQLTGTSAISFGTALQYANLASQKTGIRPAFLLGVIKEESDLGNNVGKGTWQADMSPANQPVFQAITSSLGLDPNSVPVSKKQWYGWGGAMGPAQFIPATWAKFAGYVAPSYQYDPSADRIGPLTGSHPPSPWNPQDAFMAAALYLTDSGAAAGTPAAEFRAAMCYLAGCGGANNPNLMFYGSQVATFASQFQAQINILNGS